MQVNERTFIVNRAEADLSDAMLKVLQTHDLTYLEILRILNSFMMRWLNYALREERHPDAPDTPADVA